MKKNSIITCSLGNITISVALQGFLQSFFKSDSLIHAHANYEFHILLRGHAQFETDEKTIVLMQNDAVVLFPNVFHRFSSQSKDSAILSFSFSVSENTRKTENQYYSRIFSSQSEPLDFLVIKQNLELSENIQKVSTKVYSDKLFAYEEMQALFLLIFVQIFSCLTEKEWERSENLPEKELILRGKENKYEEYDARIAMIEEYFNDYYMENISLKELSTLMYLSEKQTDRIIRKAFGNGFQQHLSMIRLKRAQKFLRDSDMEIKQVAECCGYQSYNGFYLAFKKKFGDTPQEYRQRYKDAN